MEKIEESIYNTPASWGDEEYFFSKSAMDEYLAGMKQSFGEEVSLNEANILEFNTELDAYESDCFRLGGQRLRHYYRVTDWSDPSDLIVEHLGTFKYNIQQFPK